jgi:hypothetical protein
MRRILTLAVCASVLCFIAGVAFADCTATCSSGTCTFDGILNTPLGAAVLSVDAQCRLLVGNVGGSGQDGVVQENLNSQYMVTTVATPNFSGSLLGTKAAITQVGTVNGVPNQVVSVTQIVNVTGDMLRMDMDCAYIQVESYSTEIYDNGGLVFAQSPTTEPPVLLFPKGDFIAMACALLPNGDLYTTMSFAGPTPFTLQTRDGNIGPLTGTCVKMRGYRPARVPTMQQAIENRFTNTGTMPIVSLYAGPLPSQDTVCPLAPVPVRPTTWGAVKALYR